MARYLRVANPRPWGTGDLEITELQLWASGVRVDASAAKTSYSAPSAGALTDLADGTLSTAVVWTAEQWLQPGMSITIDMGSDLGTVDELRIGTGTSKAKSLMQFVLMVSTDGAAWEAVNLPASPVGAVAYATASTLVTVTASVGQVAMPTPVTQGGRFSLFGLTPATSDSPTTHLVGVTPVNAYRIDGTGYIEGTTALDGDPNDDEVPDTYLGALVRLFRDSDGFMVKETRSNSLTGVWRFERISMDFTYTALAYHDTRDYRAVVADRVSPEPMP